MFIGSGYILVLDIFSHRINSYIRTTFEYTCGAPPIGVPCSPFKSPKTTVLTPNGTLFSSPIPFQVLHSHAPPL